ncbi:MAG: CDP-alcohol phosphatidyltransferase family protein, partial [Promethearchaeota archaeon]
MCPSRFRVRGIFRGLVYRVARPLQKRNINPDSVTYLSLLIALVSLLALVLFQSEPLFGILVFTVGFLDGVDGAVAKGAGIASQAGALTDSVIDKVSEAIILTGIALAFS